jgi:hypothetical protein
MSVVVLIPSINNVSDRQRWHINKQIAAEFYSRLLTRRHNSRTPGGKNHGMPCSRFGRYQVGGTFYRNHFISIESIPVSWALLIVRRMQLRRYPYVNVLFIFKHMDIVNEMGMCR